VGEIQAAWAAFTAMLRAALRDPVWAIVAVISSPFRYWRAWFFGLLFVTIVAVVLSQIVAHVLPKGPLQMAGNAAVSVVLVVLIFRMITHPLVTHFGVQAADTHGTARFATDREMAPLTEPKAGLLIGRTIRTKKPLYYDGPAHLLTMAPTRSGKGVGTVIPNLLTANRSVICIDPKGENAAVTGQARNHFGPVHVLDPFGATSALTSAFNPLDRLDPDSLDVAEDAAVLADALVYDAPGEAGEAHWNEEAKALITGILLYIVGEEPLERRTLVTLRDYLTLAPDAFSALLTRMQASRAAGGLAARAANRHLGKSDREATGVLSSAQRHTHFLDSPRMAAVLDRSDFAFSDLRQRVATVFLVLPPDRIGAYARWLRLMVSQSLQDAMRTARDGQGSVLYLLDEFAALGYLAPIERAMGLMAGYGLQLWPILQDVHQLRATYGERAGTFLSNAGVLQVFGVNDYDSAKMVSDLLGSETVVFQTASRALDSEKSGLSYSAHHTGRPLLTPDEVRNLGSDIELLFLAGLRPIAAQKLRYYADREFAGLFHSS
jgi:type IV secretion system protein VirD4